MFIESVPMYSPGRINLRIGKHGRGESQIATLSLTQARLLAYALLRAVEERLERIERLNEEARRTRKQNQKEQ